MCACLAGHTNGHNSMMSPLMTQIHMLKGIQSTKCHLPFLLLNEVYSF